MKTLLTDFPETAHKELARITALIREAADPEFIVLFGRYAQTPMPGARGGYELLVVTDREPAPRPQELLQCIETAFPRAERSERFLFLHCLPMAFVSGHLSLSLFLRTIVAEGVLLYDSRRFRYFRIRDFKPAQSARKAQENYALWYGQGKACLHTAKWTLLQGYTRLAANNLYLAAAAFLKAAELVCYGYQNPHSDLRALYIRTARFSAELSELFGFPERFDRKIFYRLEAFRRNAATSPRFVLHAEAYQYVLEKVTRMGDIVRDLCGEWLERLDAIRYAAPGFEPPIVSESAVTAELPPETESDPTTEPSAAAKTGAQKETAGSEATPGGVAIPEKAGSDVAACDTIIPQTATPEAMIRGAAIPKKAVPKERPGAAVIPKTAGSDVAACDILTLQTATPEAMIRGAAIPKKAVPKERLGAAVIPKTAGSDVAACDIIIPQTATPEAMAGGAAIPETTAPEAMAGGAAIPEENSETTKPAASEYFTTTS